MTERWLSTDMDTNLTLQEQTELLTERVRAIRAEMDEAAKQAGREGPAAVLTAATKTQTSETIRAAIAAGISICGENRVQELLSHLEDNAYEGASVHFIGHLQTNKVKQVVGRVDLIESVDSQRLLEAIDKQAEKLGIRQDILLEVNIGREESKGGLSPEEVLPLAIRCGQFPHVRLRGLMCIPPAAGTEAETRRFFAETSQLFIDTKNKIGDNTSNIDCLSMGMSGDYALAVEEGSTMVRVGTALFGSRPPLPTAR